MSGQREERGERRGKVVRERGKADEKGDEITIMGMEGTSCFGRS